MDMLTIGVIRTSHGINGLLKVRSTSGEKEHFSRLKEVTFRSGTESRSFSVEEVRFAGEEILLKVKGIDAPEEAKLFSGWEIVVPRDKAAPLRDGEYYIADLCGCIIIQAGKEMGIVRSFIEGGATDIFEVERTDGTTVLIPFVDEWVGEVDLKRRTIELRDGWNME